MENINNFLESMHIDGVVTQVLVVMALTIIISFIVSKIFKKLQQNYKETKNIWDISFVKSAKNPLTTLILILGSTFSLEILHNTYKATILSAASPIKKIGIVVVIGWFFIAFIKEIQRIFTQTRLVDGSDPETKIDKTALDAIGTILTVLVVVLVGISILQIIGVQIGGILALGGVGGIAIGFAAKDLLSNFFGGIMIYLDQPFKIGDWIKSPDKEIEGVVVKIGWRQTQILTFEKRPLYVPNSIFSNIIVENPSRMLHRRINEVIGLRYDDISKVEKIVKEVKDMILNHEGIEQSQSVDVYFSAFSASSIDFFFKCFTKTPDWVEFNETKQDILLKVAKIVENNKAEIAFPTSTIHLFKQEIQENSTKN